MTNYALDILGRTATEGATPDDVRKALLNRPFQLFYPPPVDDAKLYVASDALRDAANVAIATGRALLLTGGPGTGKSSAANWLAHRLGRRLLRFQVKSTSNAQDLLYQFNSIDYFRASQIEAAAGRKEPLPKADFVEEGPLWEALVAEDGPLIILVDEIDKAPRDFPNDLLNELDRMEITCKERNNEVIRVREAGMRPIMVITSNSERRLPEPFLRRCVYQNLEIDETTFLQMLDTRLKALPAFVDVDQSFRAAAEDCFLALKADTWLQKPPSFGEFWHWFVLVEDSAEDRKAVIEANTSKRYTRLPHLSALIKQSDDIDRLGDR